jgi:Mn-dependent DtxR family transcriptional regulator
MAEQKQNTLANFLTTALDMEDEIANSVYKDYIKAENWPKNLKPETFQQIKEYLTILIEDTRRHRKIIEGLIKQNDRNKRPE